ncbi:DNA-binding domain-containing protein [Horticoccus luteus]|uniref:DNA-binding domain-containing protein n=1 Tax=Horticoccus luteus TaxID=2862869 RepID=A0A8F9TYZ4_9BACT|nr:DNA-binding domain-containing protein [Horticoccus luteus]QYM80586.1 DNA-binding domain-containing protein [Horticoccus luteus]
MRPLPAAAPGRIQSLHDLHSLQRVMFAAVSRPLSAQDRAQRRWVDGRATHAVVKTFARDTGRLSALDRIEIYNRMYWFRLLDSLGEDFPGLRMHLGEARFLRLARAYIATHPSRSFTLRDLGRHLPRFIAAQPRHTAPHTAAARNLAAFEWAQIVAFDAAARAPVSVRRMRTADPLTLRLALQPCLTLLRLSFAVDDYLLALKQHDSALRTAASQTVRPGRRTAKGLAGPRLRAATTFLAVHRFQNQIYFRRLAPSEFRLLRALARGQPLADACGAAFRSSRTCAEEQAALIREWFEHWTRLGWLCARE